VLTSDKDPIDLGEIHNRWVKRAASAMAEDETITQNWLTTSSFEEIATYVLNAATTGNGR
jgi:hypothetical protein